MTVSLIYERLNKFYIMVNKKFIHFEHYDTFLSKKLSADKNNTTYTLGVGGEVFEGEPDYPYQSIIFIKDKKMIFTHGELYSASGESDRLKEAVIINGTSFDGSEDIVTDLWGAERNISIIDSIGNNQGKMLKINGGEDIKLALPKTIEANVTNDSEGNNIAQTYSTKTELTDAISKFVTFNIYSSDTDNDPTLSSYPSSEWTNQDLREEHAGDYYVTSTGRIFQFYEDSKKGWGWREITDYYLYSCQKTITSLEARIKALEDKLNETAAS